MLRVYALAGVLALAACGQPRGNGVDAAPRHDAASLDAATFDASTHDAASLDAVTHDAASLDAAIHDAAGLDAAVVHDATSGNDAATGQDATIIHDAPTGVITGGPCLSGQPGATAYRVRWTGTTSSSAHVVYEVNGLPDHTRDHAAAYGYQIGFTPSFVDPFLGEGGLQLDGSDFIDLELTTVGIHHITRATLSLYGRSFNTTASGSFSWQTFEGTGASPTNSVSNVAPYHWDSADMTTELSPGNANVLVRIKAGPSSGALVVNRVELCLQAD